MTPRVEIDRISLTLDGITVDAAQFVAAQLHGALLAQLNAPGGGTQPEADELPAGLTGEALVQAVAARIAAAIPTTAGPD